MVAASLIAGCSTEVKKLPITYIPQQNVQAIKGADAVPVEVTVEDLEPAEYASPWAPLNPFWDRILQFRVKDAADTIKSTAETELRARGFKVGTGGALVEIQLIHFEATLSKRGFNDDGARLSFDEVRGTAANW